MTTVRYSVWIEVEHDDHHDKVAEAFRNVPGFVEYSWEDSYDA